MKIKDLENVLSDSILDNLYHERKEKLYDSSQINQDLKEIQFTYDDLMKILNEQKVSEIRVKIDDYIENVYKVCGEENEKFYKVRRN